MHCQTNKTIITMVQHYNYNSNFSGINSNDLFATREENIKEYEALKEKTISLAKFIIEDYIPTYVVGELYDDRLILCPRKKARRNLTIEIYFGEHFIRQGVQEYKINPATVGSFTIDEDSEERRYFIAIGQLLSDNPTHSTLRNTLFKWHFEAKEIVESCHSISNELKKRERDAFIAEALAQEKKHFEECIKPGFTGDLNNMFTLVEKCSDASDANAIYRKKPIKVLCSPSDMNNIVGFKKEFSKHQQAHLAIILADKVKFN